jgi:hypothetical protein
MHCAQKLKIMDMFSFMTDLWDLFVTVEIERDDRTRKFILCHCSTWISA